MWVQAGFSPDSFWHQTPRHFQLAMRGVRKRLESEAQARTLQAYETGAFGALGYHGKLKPFPHYMKKQRAQTPAEMMQLIQEMGRKSNMQVRRLN